MAVKQSQTVYKTHRNLSEEPSQKEYICNKKLITKELKLRNSSTKDNEEPFTSGMRKIERIFSKIPEPEDGQEKVGSIFLCVSNPYRVGTDGSVLDNMFVYNSDRNIRFYLRIGEERLVDMVRQKASVTETKIPFSITQDRVQMSSAISLLDKGDGTVVRKPMDNGFIELSKTTTSGRRQTFLIKESTMPDNENQLCMISTYKSRLFLAYQSDPQVAIWYHITATRGTSKLKKWIELKRKSQSVNKVSDQVAVAED